MVKKMAVPISDCLVDTLSSLGTGIKLKISTFLNILRQQLGCYSEMKESDLMEDALAI